MEIRRATTDAELEALLNVRNCVLPVDAITLENLRSTEQQAAELEHAVAWEGEGAVGAATYGLLKTKPDPFAFSWVLLEHRRRGIGSALYRQISCWARVRERDTLECWVEDTPDGVDFAIHRGFTEIGRELRVALDLTAIDPPPAEPLNGITITTWAERPDVTESMYAVAIEAQHDIPGEEDEAEKSLEDWLADDMRGSGDRPEATFVALAGNEVVGYSKFSLTPAQPRVAHHDLTAVKRTWRRRGVARALKQAQIVWAREAGYERLETRNEERNEPIRRLNAELGYRPSGCRILFSGPLAGAASGT
jgi:GNAT superfamily N-acetyltransferase